jgi:hypothetical protein
VTRARQGADKIAERRNRAASPRSDPVDGYVLGGRSETITPPSQG